MIRKSRARLDNTAMPQIQLTPAQRKVHRAEAHHLDPVVMVGGDGLTPAVKKETDAALNAHGLIKVRVLGDDRQDLRVIESVARRGPRVAGLASGPRATRRSASG